MSVNDVQDSKFRHLVWEAAVRFHSELDLSIFNYEINRGLRKKELDRDGAASYAIDPCINP